MVDIVGPRCDQVVDCCRWEQWSFTLKQCITIAAAEGSVPFQVLHISRHSSISFHQLQVHERQSHRDLQQHSY
ncbi:hypothetical protein ACOMHN_052689 [Nucella lapillus]